MGAPCSADCVALDAFACWVCGGESQRGAVAADWVAGNFTGSDRIRRPDSRHVCEACVYVMSRLSPVPGRPPKDGSEFGANFRNFSHLVHASEYMNASKGEKPCVRAWLRATKQGPWFAAIADSGQKHVVPFAPVNPHSGRGGLVLFEEAVVSLPNSEHEWRIVDDACQLLTDGATKESLKSGDYAPGEYQRCAAQILAFEAAYSRLRHSPWFALVVWLAQRDEEAVAARMAAEKAKRVKNGKAGRVNKDGVEGANSVAAPRTAYRVSLGGRVAAQTLGPDARPDARSNTHNVDSGRMGHGHRKGSATINPDQLRLFGR